MAEDPKLVVLEAIKQTGKVIETLDREPLHTKRYLRLTAELAKLAEAIKSARRVALLAIVVAIVALFLSTGAGR